MTLPSPMTLCGTYSITRSSPFSRIKKSHHPSTVVTSFLRPPTPFTASFRDGAVPSKRGAFNKLPQEMRAIFTQPTEPSQPAGGYPPSLSMSALLDRFENNGKGYWKICQKPVIPQKSWNSEKIIINIGKSWCNLAFLRIWQGDVTLNVRARFLLVCGIPHFACLFEAKKSAPWEGNPADFCFFES